MSPAVRTKSFRTIFFHAIPSRTILVHAILPGMVVAWVLPLTATSVWAQTAIDDVHIMTREKPMEVATAAYVANTGSSGGYAGSLIRTSVDLVLVPVSITDDYHRPVIGLDQENFQLFEGKKRQAIKHFSSEDTPISVGIII